MEEKKAGGWATNFNNNRWGGAGVVICSYVSKERGVLHSSPLLVVTPDWVSRWATVSGSIHFDEEEDKGWRQQI